MNILIVDDNAENLLLLETFIKPLHFDYVFKALDAQSALSVLGMEPYREVPSVGVITLDILMPDIDGIEVCRRIKADARYSNIPIIMVTAINEMGYLSAAFSAGASDFIYKPFQKEELVARVSSAARLTNEIEARKEKEIELTQARDKAEHHLEAKNRFLANVSHELRTPLHHIMGLSKAVMGSPGKYQPQQMVEFFSEINESGSRLLQLFDKLLRVASTGKEDKSKLQSTDIWLFCTTFIAENRKMFSQKNLAVESENRSTCSICLIDREQMRLVFDSVFDNAVRYSAEDSSIKITLSDMPTALLISIEDEGIGVPDFEMETVFDPFTQGSRTNNGSGGAGLGLALSRDIVNWHKGRIWLSAGRAGAGTCVNIELPTLDNRQQ